MHKVAFDRMEWNSPMEGVRDKTVVQDGLALRLVEYNRSMPLHWCDRGHWGCLIEGEMEIEFDAESVRYAAGDGIFIPDGVQHRHRARVLSERAVAFFVQGIAR